MQSSIVYDMKNILKNETIIGIVIKDEIKLATIN